MAQVRERPWEENLPGCPGEWKMLYDVVVCVDPEGYLYVPR